MARRIVAATGLVLVAAVAVCAASCLEPTQVRITVTTDVCELADVKIFRNDQEVASTKPAQPCNHDGTVGTLVFVPSGKGERFVLKVQGTLPGGSCNAGSTTCVTSLRTVSFQKHASFELPIALSRSCVGVMCDPTETCERGACVPIPSACPIPPCNGDDAGQGQDAIADAPPVDTGIDSGVLCGGQFKSPFSYGTILHAWNFEEGKSPIKDLISAALVDVPGHTFVPSAAGCGTAMQVDTMTLAPTQLSAGIGITVSMLVRIPPGSSAPILYGLDAPFGYWDIDFVDDNNTSARPEVNVHASLDESVTSKLKIPYDNAYHLLEISMQGTTAAFAVDGSVVDVGSTMSASIADAQSLSFGSDSKIAIDQLRIYKAATH